MVILNSYVSLPEGNGSYNPRTNRPKGVLNTAHMRQIFVFFLAAVFFSKHRSESGSYLLNCRIRAIAAQSRAHISLVHHLHIEQQQWRDLSRRVGWKTTVVGWAVPINPPYVTYTYVHQECRSWKLVTTTGNKKNAMEHCPLISSCYTAVPMAIYRSIFRGGHNPTCVETLDASTYFGEWLVDIFFPSPKRFLSFRPIIPNMLEKINKLFKTTTQWCARFFSS
jgi:hypothetical protein